MKRYLLGFFALLLAATTTAFVVDAATEKKTPPTAVWFDFVGSPGQENDPEMYVLDENNIPECHEETSGLCEIKAPIESGTNPAQPDLTQIQDSKYYE